MSSPKQTSRLVEQLYAHNPEQESLFQLIAALANCLDRDIVIETMKHILSIEPVEKGDCVNFDDIAVRFDADGRVKSLSRVINGH